METDRSFSRLIEENEKLTSDLEMAGQLGKTLLETNKEYQNRIEELSHEVKTAAVRIEEFKQENHVLKCRIETEISANRNHVFEQESLKERLEKEFKERETATHNANEKKVKELRKEIESLQNDIGKHILVEGQLQEKIQRQEEIMENLRKYSEELQSKSILETEVEEQRRISAHLQMELDSVVMSLSDMKDLKQRFEFDNDSLKQQISCVNEELKEKTRQSETWYNCLQEARQENGELKAELQILKAEKSSGSFRGKGNSLFGEVEDRRLELEKKFVSLQAEHECLVKTYTLTKQQLHRLKNEVAGLFNVKGTYADSCQIERLKAALTHSRDEIKMLSAKLASIDRQQSDSCLDSRMKEFHEAFSDFGDKKDYVEYLQLQLEESKKANATLKKEFETKTLLQLSESDKLRHAEGQLHKAECNIETLNNENLKLRLKVDELKVKLLKYIKTEEKKLDASKKPVQQDASSVKFSSANTSKPHLKNNAISFTKPLQSASGIHEKQKFTVSSQEAPISNTEISKKPVVMVTPLQSKPTLGKSAAITLRKRKNLNNTNQTYGSSGLVEELDNSIASSSETHLHLATSHHQLNSTAIGAEIQPQPANSHQVIEPVNGRRTRESFVRFDLPNVEDDGEQGDDPFEENKLGFGPSQKRSKLPNHTSVLSSNKSNETIKVRGQHIEPTVIHVKKDMTKKNECAQQ